MPIFEEREEKKYRISHTFYCYTLYKPFSLSEFLVFEARQDGQRWVRTIELGKRKRGHLLK